MTRRTPTETEIMRLSRGLFGIASRRAQTDRRAGDAKPIDRR
jgi:hypothetical protein